MNIYSKNEYNNKKIDKMPNVFKSGRRCNFYECDIRVTFNLKMKKKDCIVSRIKRTEWWM